MNYEPGDLPYKLKRILSEGKTYDLITLIQYDSISQWKEYSANFFYCLFLYKKGKKLDGALWYGKVSTAVFYLSMIILIGVPTLSSVVANGLILITMAVLSFAFVMYMIIFMRMHKEKQRLDKKENICDDKSTIKLNITYKVL